ncbi:hypothetical protein ACQP2P_16080 [Dactylosporangium sp. CA-139114]|uniref:hypothetical protein n=1 Tax=Dactylosporangium sp. CA-139114 TaxID=3239931 RepID=UPI003D989401
MQTDFPLVVVGDPGRAAEFVPLAHRCMTELATALHLPGIAITVRVVDDFVAAVLDAAARGELPNFGSYDPERVGGIAAAKNIVMTADGSVVEIIVDAGLLADPDVTPGHLLWLLLHEFMHPVSGRLRATCGTDLTTSPNSRCAEARKIAYRALEELRCDRLAGALLTQTATVTLDDGTTQPLTLARLNDLGYTLSVHAALDDRVYPGWPDLVDQYRTWQIPLEQLWNDLVHATDGVINLLGRAQAEVESIGHASVFRGVEEHPAVRLYLGPVWQQVTDALARQPALAPATAFGDQEQQALDVAEAAILDLWQRLGVEVAVTDAGMRLNVAAPARDAVQHAVS